MLSNTSVHRRSRRYCVSRRFRSHRARPGRDYRWPHRHGHRRHRAADRGGAGPGAQPADRLQRRHDVTRSTGQYTIQGIAPERGLHRHGSPHRLRADDARQASRSRSARPARGLQADARSARRSATVDGRSRRPTPVINASKTGTSTTISDSALTPPADAEPQLLRLRAARAAGVHDDRLPLGRRREPAPELDPDRRRAVGRPVRPRHHGPAGRAARTRSRSRSTR